MPKGQFWWVFKTWSLLLNSVTRLANFNRTNIGGKCQMCGIWVIFKQCVILPLLSLIWSAVVPAKPMPVAGDVFKAGCITIFGDLLFTTFLSWMNQSCFLLSIMLSQLFTTVIPFRLKKGWGLFEVGLVFFANHGNWLQSYCLYYLLVY